MTKIRQCRVLLINTWRKYIESGPGRNVGSSSLQKKESLLFLSVSLQPFVHLFSKYCLYSATRRALKVQTLRAPSYERASSLISLCHYQDGKCNITPFSLLLH